VQHLVHMHAKMVAFGQVQHLVYSNTADSMLQVKTMAEKTIRTDTVYSVKNVYTNGTIVVDL
jgi:hypothetical protein